MGDFNEWQENEKYEAHRIEGTGNWELKLKEKDLKHGDLYKMHVYWDGGFGERIPAWTRRVVQDEQTKIFSAQVWNPAEQYVWKKESTISIITAMPCWWAVSMRRLSCSGVPKRLDEAKKLLTW